MRKLILAATTIAALAVPTIAPALASASVDRYQTTNKITLDTLYNGVHFLHNYTITQNSCGSDSFTGTEVGGIVGGQGETVQGTLNGANITIQGQYHDGSGYTWNYSGPLTGGGVGHDSLGLTWNTTFRADTSNFKNHGEYVSSQGGGSDAAHSCIGMPIH
jgi:opacity protein-like surface antigen